MTFIFTVIIKIDIRLFNLGIPSFLPSFFPSFIHSFIVSFLLVSFGSGNLEMILIPGISTHFSADFNSLSFTERPFLSFICQNWNCGCFMKLRSFPFLFYFLKSVFDFDFLKRVLMFNPFSSIFGCIRCEILHAM